MKYKVLVVDDEFLIRMTLESGLSDRGYQVESASGVREGLERAEALRPHVVLLDNRLGSERGMDAIAAFKQLDEEVQVILMTAYGSVSQAVEAMKLGVSNYIQKPFDLDEIDLIIRRGMEQLASRRTVALMRRSARKLIGVSPALQRIQENIKVLAENDNVDLLICGETGTGKEVVVNSIHDQSSRRDKPLVKINCGAIPENLLESELFGYEKGAFTGAGKTKKGLMELADGGTVFLDEIGEMPLFMQAKLLTFLEDRCFKRVGGLRDIEVNVRVAAATNRKLEEEVHKGTFREDLYYRLNVMQIHIPPLRERPEDVPALCQFYLEHFNRKFNKSLKGIDPAFLQAMEQYYWKGNVRELRNVMECCTLFSKGELLTGTEAQLPLAQPVQRLAGSGGFPLKDLRQGAIDLKKETEAFEMAYIRQALKLTDGNLSQAAALLGTTRFTLKRRLEQEE
ncbi:MAG: sigma-54-dependent Fis family transcriptional regulator [Oscillospiraceae bacterium]|nr:sigma-54-dependent Fis family transcriptional regulator [Oscillospiraceae bacterium]MCI9581385.1 sigma-54-dependent Fis family transcriptional regulator [Oscillospiraceae bacterium]